MSSGPNSVPPLRDPQELAAELGPASDWLLVLDFDGTLAPIVDHPDLATPADGALEIVTELAGRTQVAVVSGRPIDDVRRRLGGLAVAYAGGHGAELVLADGSPAPLLDPATVTATLDQVESEISALVDDEPGWLVERKQASVAVHHRLAAPDSVSDHLPRIQALLERLATSPPGFEVLAGKAVLELRPAGIDKGAALTRIAEATDARPPLVVGDDVTDEDAFLVARARGGRGVLVAEEERASAAADRLTDPDAVVRLLSALARTGS